MKTRPATEYAILGALRSGPKHGYDILQLLETRLGSTWYVSTSQLYVLLKKLEDRKWLRSSVAAQRKRPAKRVFSLTPEGERAFEQWLFSPTKHVRDLRIEFLTKLFFIRDLGFSGGEALVASQVKLLEALKETLLERRKRSKDEFRELVWDARIAGILSWMEWLKTSAGSFLSEEGKTLFSLDLDGESGIN
jgi:DNA-binding PadR family transcriptional regulator